MRFTLASATVVRQRATESQAGLTPRQRRQNVRGAFVVPDPEAVTGRNVLVIDDIMTTGATVRSVAQVLLRAGAAKVWVATLARANQSDKRAAGQFDHESQIEGANVPAAREPAAARDWESSQPSF